MGKENESPPSQVTRCKMCLGTGMYRIDGRDGVRTCQCKVGQKIRKGIFRLHDSQMKLDRKESDD